ncbi:MAG: dienelactone hydrolase family protein [Blastocatellia bacterium]
MSADINAAPHTYTAGDKSAGGYLARPAGHDPAPAVMVIHEWWGLNDHIREITQRFARAGFVAAAVDLYDGAVTADPQQAGQMMSGLDPQKALANLGTAISWLRTQDFVGAVGITGFCMGGLYSLVAACNLPLDAAVPFYGMPDDLGMVANLNCPVLFIGAEKDQWITVDKMNRLDAAFQAHGRNAEVKIYAGADHAFFNDTRPEVYSAADAADAWTRTIDFLTRHLKKGQASSA